MEREVTLRRTTKETDISLSLKLDGTGKNEIDTGIGFFDHMLDGFARHGLFDLSVTVKGDLLLARQSFRQWGIRGESSDTDILFCLWMRLLHFAP